MDFTRFSENNWYNVTWHRSFIDPYLDTMKFSPNFTRPIKTQCFKESVQEALIKITESRPGLPLVMCYSGGLDSEIVIQTAIDMGIDIIPAFLKFGDNLNDHEYYYVKRFAERTGISVLEVDLDVVSWLSSRHDEFDYIRLIEKYQYWHLAASLMVKLRDEINRMVGPCVVTSGSGDISLTKMTFPDNITKFEWAISTGVDSYWNRARFFAEHYPHDVPFFFHYTPEITWSFLTSPEFKHCVTPDSFKLGSTSSRHNLYARLWPQCERRPKYDGGEKLKPEMYAPDTEPHQPIKRQLQLWTKYEDYFRIFERHAI